MSETSASTQPPGAPAGFGRLDGAKLATGLATFADDLAPDDLLHARLLRSPHAHARIVGLDAARARGLPGVACVLTADDLPALERPLLGRVVRYVGERVALVAAEDPELALRACEAIVVEYEMLPAATEPESAPEAARLWVACGDVEAALAQADRSFEASYDVPFALELAPEPFVALAWLDEDDRLCVRTPHPDPAGLRHELATRLGLAPGRIRVVPPRERAASRARRARHEDLAALAAMRTRRPVRLATALSDDLLDGGLRAAARVRVRSAVKGGRLTALDVRFEADVGAGEDFARDVLAAAAGHAFSLYRCENACFAGRAAATNRPPAGSVPGDGASQGLFALECHVDEVAVALEQDRLAFRLRHVVAAGDPSWIAGALARPAAEPAPRLSSCGLADAVTRGAAAFGWKRALRRRRENGGLRRGVGLALASGGHFGGPTRGSAWLARNEDGSLRLRSDAFAFGGAAETLLCRIAAEAAGLALERVAPVAWDSDSLPGESAGALSLHAAAEAVVTAARRLRDDPPGASRSEDASATVLASLEPVSFGAAFAEVEVDTETGELRVIRLLQAVDCGRVLDTAAAELAVAGDTLRGLTRAVSHRVSFDADGRAEIVGTATASAVDAPRLEVLLLGGGDPTGPLGAKLGDGPGAHAAAAAIANAVSSAVGARLRERPLFPERLLSAIRP